ncbi:MAG: cobalamin biosynthesis protein [Thermoproteus sp. AZ2]|jgi:cobalt/nickel transport protein|uniref:Cobalamin biosynthesis protein n=1 Tax=Thermoproteus sp. AZ2 TaxID=1609232 RepID=A0ACC6V069_9CREN
MMGRRYLLLLIALALISPIFGVILANVVNYAEPLDHVGEALHLQDLSDKMNWTPFIGYAVPGLPDWLGYIISAFIGLAVFMAIYYAVTKWR